MLPLRLRGSDSMYYISYLCNTWICSFSFLLYSTQLQYVIIHQGPPDLCLAGVSIQPEHLRCCHRGSDSLYYNLYLCNTWLCSLSSVLYTCTQLQYVITPSNYVYNTEIYTNALSLKTLGWLIQYQTNTQIIAGLLTTQTLAV